MSTAWRLGFGSGKPRMRLASRGPSGAADKPYTIMRRVVKSPAGGWDVTGPRSGRSIAHTARKRNAERLARNIVRQAGAGSVAIYDTDGVLRQRWTYIAEPEQLSRGKYFEEEVVK